jgi:hypothetical protein
MHRRNMARQHGIEEWQVNIPTFKSHCAAATVTTLAYMFHGEFLSRALGVSLQRSTQQKVACIYTEAKTLTQICQELTGRRNPRNVVFAYGMGRFSASSRGYKPAPANQRWVKNRLTKCLHAKLSISTSTTPRKFAQTALLVKLCAVGSNRDPFTAQPGSILIQKSHLRAKMYTLPDDLEQRCERIEKYGLSGAPQGLRCGPTCVVQQSTGSSANCS